MKSLLRYLNPLSGPVVKLESSLHPGLLMPFYWYSIAELTSEFCEKFGYRFSIPTLGTAWARDKEISQAKALYQAIEKTAPFYYKDQPKAALLDLDNSPTGFTATPRVSDQDFGFRKALCDSLKNWVLNRMSDSTDLPLEEVSPSVLPRKLRLIFLKSMSRLKIFKSHVRQMGTENLEKFEATFVFVVLSLKSGGIVFGSACEFDFEQALESATLNLFEHKRKIDRILSGYEQLPPKITIQRLWHYYFNSEAAGKVLRKLEGSRVEGEAQVLAPEIVCVRDLEGPWQPEISMTRVLVADSLPFYQGGLDRLLI